MFALIIVGLIILLLIAFMILWLWMELPNMILNFRYLLEEIRNQKEVWRALFTKEDDK